MSAVLREELKDKFRYENFYSDEQEEATLAVLCASRDVYVNLQPGGGKSLCFQLPTLLKPRSVTIVFVPSRILAQVHMKFLNGHGIEAEYIDSRMRKDQRRDLLDSLGTDRMKFQFLYASTEKSTGEFAKQIAIKLNSLNALAYIVFDEAHCISKLSHDYVSTYNDSAKLMKDVCPDIRKIALSGTSTMEVRQDVIDVLGMKNARIYMSCPNYHNTYHDVRFMDKIPDPKKHLKEFIEGATGDKRNPAAMDPTKCGIIFCRKKTTAVAVAESLRADNEYFPRGSVVAYHGDLSLKERASIHERWLAGEINVIAVTQQFGIELRGRAVNFIVHWSMPTSMQQLIQSTGGVDRARRMYCRVYFSCEEETDIMTHIKSMLRSSTDEIDTVARKLRFFQEVIDYCFEEKCRHIAQWSYFGRTVEYCKDSCDICQNKYGHRMRVKDFRNYRESVLNKMLANLRLPRRRKKDAHAIAAEKQTIDDLFGEDEKLESLEEKFRERECLKLRDSLLENYKCGKGEFNGKLDENDIGEVARRLEHSVFTGTNLPKKYRHDIHHTIQIIKTCTDSGVICGYLAFSQAQPLRNPEVQIEDVYRNPEGQIEVIDFESPDEPAEGSTNNACGTKRKRVDEATTVATGMDARINGERLKKIRKTLLSDRSEDVTHLVSDSD